MRLIETLATLVGFRSREEIEQDESFQNAVEAQANGAEELAAARARLEDCRTRIHSRAAAIENVATKAKTRGRHDSKPEEKLAIR